jgi:NAD-dependent deacetylase
VRARPAADPAAALSELLAPARGDGLLVVTGAGVSLASGIPTFRGSDPGAVWTRDVLELGTIAFFRADPVASWRWYLSRFDRAAEARPNEAHRALVALEDVMASRGIPFLLVTQNVDTLHEQAGSRALVKVHGSVDRVRCARDGCRLGAPSGSIPRAEVDVAAFLADPGPATLPRCPACGSPVRQHVLWFDECYDSHDDYQFVRVLAGAATAGRVLFVGTSFSVGVTEAVLLAARRRGAAVLSIDPGVNPGPPGVTTLRAKAEDVLPAAVAALAVA